MSSASTAAPPHHMLDLPAKTIKTEPFLRAQLAIADCSKARALGVIVGDAGTGKTFAIASALTGSDIPVVSTLFSFQATPREVARQMVESATGERRRGTRFELTDDCVDLFRAPHVAVVDEAQHLNRDCTYFLRYLLDHPETNVAIILAGGNGCWERLASDPMLRSRVYRKVLFDAAPQKVLLKALPSYHPIYADIDRELLVDLWDRLEIARLRTLAIFTHTAAGICEESGREALDEYVLNRAIELMGHGRE